MRNVFSDLGSDTEQNQQNQKPSVFPMGKYLLVLVLHIPVLQRNYCFKINTQNVLHCNRENVTGRLQRKYSTLESNFVSTLIGVLGYFRKLGWA